MLGLEIASILDDYSNHVVTKYLWLTLENPIDF